MHVPIKVHCWSLLASPNTISSPFIQQKQTNSSVYPHRHSSSSHTSYIVHNINEQVTSDLEQVKENVKQHQLRIKRLSTDMTHSRAPFMFLIHDDRKHFRIACAFVHTTILQPSPLLDWRPKIAWIKKGGRQPIKYTKNHDKCKENALIFVYTVLSVSISSGVVCRCRCPKIKYSSYLIIQIGGGSTSAGNQILICIGTTLCTAMSSAEGKANRLGPLHLWIAAESGWS